MKRWDDQKKAEFAADVGAGMKAGPLAVKYQTSRGAVVTRIREVELAGGKVSHDSTLARHLNYEVKSDRVSELRASHPALASATTIFPKSRQSALGAARLLVSGAMNRKVGGEVRKGEWAGMPIFTLTLEERATCPTSCALWAGCYGNAMHFAKRNVVDDHFEKRLALEVALLAMTHRKGFVVRLHVLGDFYSVPYVDLWHDLLAQFDQVNVFGYSARLPEDADEKTAAIGRAIETTKQAFPSRFRIRFSRGRPEPDSTMVLRAGEELTGGIVCAAERDMTACCGTCGMCWAEAMKGEAIVFKLHGMKKRGRRKN